MIIRLKLYYIHTYLHIDISTILTRTWLGGKVISLLPQTKWGAGIKHHHHNNNKASDHNLLGVLILNTFFCCIGGLNAKRPTPS